MVEQLPISPRPLPSTGASSGVLEALAFFRDADFAQQRFAQFGNVYETRLLGQPLVFIRGGEAIIDLLAQPNATEGWWPESVRQLLGSRSLANRNGADHRARRRVVGQLFSAAALRRYTPAIVTLVEELAAELQAATAPVPLVARMRRFAFSVTATVVLGLEGDDRDALFADFEIWTRACFRFRSPCRAAPLPGRCRPGPGCWRAWLGCSSGLASKRRRENPWPVAWICSVAGSMKRACRSPTTTWWSSCCCCSLLATKPPPPP